MPDSNGIDDLINFDKYFPKLVETLDKFEEIIDFKKYWEQNELLEDKTFMGRE